jgi:hypothetical protein
MACHLHVICMSSWWLQGKMSGSNGLRTDFERTGNDYGRPGFRTRWWNPLELQWPHTRTSVLNGNRRYRGIFKRMSWCLAACYPHSRLQMSRNRNHMKPSEHKLKEYPIKMFQDVSSSLFARTTSSVVTPQISQQIGKHSHWKDCLYCLYCL